ncbi:unnamed protein product [Echinostoma caproni]|uniref:G_PROTEIN_RECEP_F1_2 domain-containing protein n=1 Tax=Echinostoma caproni TaxID=27848 RepID=A0A183A6A6_9TREM|nr:unnamed protein product [Echinostoma caproni]
MNPQELCAQDETLHKNFERFMKCKHDYPNLITFMELFASAYGVLGLTVCCLSVLSNTMNLMLLSKRWLRRPTTSILIGISAMDLCVSMSQMPILLRYYLAPIFSQDNIHHQPMDDVPGSIQNSSYEDYFDNMNETYAVCSNSTPLVNSKDFGWVCNRPDASLSRWSVAFLFILAQCTALTSHTASVWFGVVLAAFRWWLISELSRKMNRMRRSINLAQQSIQLASSVIARSDIELSRVCVQCGRAILLVHGTQRSAALDPDMHTMDTCDRCGSLEPMEKPTTDKQSYNSAGSRWFRRSKSTFETRVKFHSSESLTEQRFVVQKSDASDQRLDVDHRLSFLCRVCCHSRNRVELSRANVQRALCLVFLLVSLFLSPYYLSAQIRAAYYIIMPCDPYFQLKKSLTQTKEVVHLCVDNKTQIRTILAGYMPLRKEDSVLDSYNFWIVAGMGKLAPCCLIAAFGFRLITHLRKNLSHRLTFTGHVTQPYSCSETKGPQKAQALKNRLRNHRRTSRLLILVILLILPVELPTAIILISKRYTHQGECLYLSLGDLLDWLTLVKNALTFVIYCAMSSEFRTAFCDSTKTVRNYTRFVCTLCRARRLPNQ